jgi:hypothetical protein
MSLIKAIRKQLGLSVTPANNFTLDAAADNGTMKLARGNAGATTQDIMTVDAAGTVAFPSAGVSVTGLLTPTKSNDGGGISQGQIYINSLNATAKIGFGINSGASGSIFQNVAAGFQCLNGNSSAHVPIQASSFDVNSDARLKSNLEIIPDALSKVQQLTGYTFDINGKRDTGLIAQDVQKVLPEVVGMGGLNDMMTVNYGALVGLLVEAIKELTTKVEALESKQ